MSKVAGEALETLEQQHADGITSADLLAFFVDHGVRFGEATLRKWVQLGLLPRSVRVGTKGKHQGSRGKYPVRVVRRVLHIKELMDRDLTIEQIQRRFLFVRGDIEELQETLGQIFKLLDQAMGERSNTAAVRAAGADLSRARNLASDLVERLERIERRLVADGEQQGSQVAS